MFRDVLIPAFLQALARQDSAAAPVQGAEPESRMDAIYNSFTGLGGDYDKGRQGQIVARAALTQQQLEYAYHQVGLARRTVGLFSDWPVKEGWHLDGIEDKEQVQRFDRRLNVWSTFGQALRWSNLYGYGVVMVVTDDGADPSTPLVPTRVRRVLNLVALDATEATPASYCGDVTSQRFRMPETWNIYPRSMSSGAQVGIVHASRVILIPGLDRPPSMLGDSQLSWSYLGLSCLEPCWDELRDLVSVSQGGAVLTQEMRMDVLKVNPLTSRAASDEGAAMETRLRILAKGKGLLKMIVLGPGEDFTPRTGTVTGYGELHDRAARAFCAVAGGYGAPATLLYGDAPAGLNTDGASWQDGWENTVRTIQTERLYQALVQFYSIGLAAKDGPTGGKVPEAWDVEFNSIIKPRAKAEADLRLVVAQTDAAYIAAGVLDPLHVARSRFGEGGWSMDLERQPDLEPPDPMDEVEAEAIGAEQAALESARGDSLSPEFRRERFKVPASARGNARKVLEWRDKHGSDVRGMTSTGWARARQLASEDTVSGEDLMTMAAWFARHGAQAATRAVAPEYRDEPWRDAGWVSWLGWGGDTAKTWAVETVKRARGQ